MTSTWPETLAGPPSLPTCAERYKGQGGGLAGKGRQPFFGSYVLLRCTQSQIPGMEPKEELGALLHFSTPFGPFQSAVVGKMKQMAGSASASQSEQEQFEAEAVCVFFPRVTGCRQVEQKKISNVCQKAGIFILPLHIIDRF